MSGHSLLFSTSHFGSVIILLGSSVLIQHGYLRAAGFVLLGGHTSQPLLLICLLPLLMKNCAVECGKSKVSRNSLTVWELISVATSSVIALARFVSFTQYELLPLGLPSSEGYNQYSNYEMLVNGSILKNLIVLSDLWVRSTRRAIQRAIEIFISADYATPYYQPSLGIRWYLDAQMIPEYSLYFELLFILQPLICTGLVYKYIVDKDKIVGVRFVIIITVLDI